MEQTKHTPYSVCWRAVSSGKAEQRTAIQWTCEETLNWLLPKAQRNQRQHSGRGEPLTGMPCPHPFLGGCQVKKHQQQTPSQALGRRRGVSPGHPAESTSTLTNILHVQVVPTNSPHSQCPCTPSPGKVMNAAPIRLHSWLSRCSEGRLSCVHPQLRVVTTLQHLSH